MGKREGSASLEDAFGNEEIYGVITSGHGNTTTNAKDDVKDEDDNKGRMVGIPSFWVCAMGHLEAVSK